MVVIYNTNYNLSNQKSRPTSKILIQKIWVKKNRQTATINPGRNKSDIPTALTTSYLPDLLPIQAHDVMLQQHQHDTNNLFSTAAHAAIGQHMLEGLQPIRKEEM